MKTTLKSIRIVGNTFIATKAMEALKVKKTFKNGGGILGGYVKAGDKIKIIDCMNDIDSVSFSTDITLYRLNQNFFNNNHYLVRE